MKQCNPKCSGAVSIKWEEKIYHPSILHIVKLFFKNEREIITFPDIKMLKEIFTGRSAVQLTLKEALQTERNYTKPKYRSMQRNEEYFKEMNLLNHVKGY